MEGDGLGLGDVDGRGRTLALRCLIFLASPVSLAPVALVRSLERGGHVVVLALVLERHAAAEVGLLPVGAERDAHVRVRERLTCGEGTKSGEGEPKGRTTFV